MIKHFEFRCRCGNLIKYATFTGIHTRIERNLLIEEERKEISSFDFKDFFYKKIKGREQLYIRDKVNDQEKIRILKFYERTGYVDIETNRVFEETLLMDILQKKHKGRFNFVDIIGDFE